MTNYLEAMRASAGSGKTYALTTRYLRIFQRDVPADAILATTFTRKAAGEILGRVVNRLAEACASQEAASRLGRDLGADGFDQEAARRLLVRLCRSLHRVQIGTLDSFFSRLSRSFRYELGLPTDAVLLEEDSPAARDLRIQAIHAILTEDNRTDELAGLLDQLQRGTAPRSVTEYLDTLVVDLYGAYRRAPDLTTWARLVPPPPLSQEAIAAAIARLADLQPNIADGRQRKVVLQDIERAAVGNWDVFIDKGIAAKLAAGESKFYVPIPDDVAAAYQPLLDQSRSVLLTRLAQQTVATHRLLARYDSHYTALRRAHGMLLFADLPLALAGFLPQAPPSEIAHRLDMQIEHLLLDEFQDTDPDQWAILRPFATQIALDAAEGRSLFCVGDVKQAIYGWRGGSAEIFNQLGSDLAGLVWEDNDTSFRSSQVVLDTVNSVFSTLAANGALAKYQGESENWAYNSHSRNSKAKPPTLPGYVELIESPIPVSDDEEAVDGGDAPPQSGHAEFAAAMIAQIAKDAPDATIGVLMRKNDTARRMIFALQKLGIPASAEGGSPVSDDAAVEIILSALTMADHPGDTAAVFHVVHSPLGPVVKLTDSKPEHASEVALAIRKQLLSSGYARVIDGWARKLASSTDARGARRLVQLINLADTYDSQITLRPSDFVRYVRSTPVEEPLPSRIRVMTVHKSKGLEFDIVMLPELHSQFPRKTPALIIDRPTPTEPVRAVYRFADETTRKLDPAVEAAYHRQMGAEVREALCLLYVAMTRARHALHMVVPPLKLKKDGTPGAPGLSHAAILREAFAGWSDESAEAAAATAGKRLYAHGDPGWHRKASAEPLTSPVSQTGRTGLTSLANLTSPEDSVAAPVLPKHLPQPTRRTLKKVTPSGQARGGRVSVKDILAFDDSPAQQYGTLIHAWLARIGWLDEPLPSDAELIAHGRKAVSSQDERWCREQLPHFHRMLKLEGVRKILTRPGGGEDVELWRERRFTVRSGDRLLTGIFDRVLVTFKDGNPAHAEIWDFKTDSVTAHGVGDTLDAYRPQMRAYREALGAMLGLPDHAIQGRLLFVGIGEVFDV